MSRTMARQVAAKCPRLRGFALLFCFLLAAAGLPASEPSEVVIVIGPTPIPGGDAQGARDITLINSKLAVAFAVDSTPPWGIPPGGVLDIAAVQNGVIGPDRASLLDFLPDSWSKWIASAPETRVLRHGREQAVVQTLRNWKGVEIITSYRLDADSNSLQVLTEMKNRGASAHAEILSGYALWPDGGFLFGLPGLAGLAAGETGEALADWSAAYDEDWVLALHAPFADRMQDDGRDRYLLHDLAPGESRRFEAWLQVEPEGSLAPLVAWENHFRQRPTGRVAGAIRSSGDQVPSPSAVVAEQWADGAFQPYTWDLSKDGRYALDLPAGRYRLYAAARDHRNSESVVVDLAAGQVLARDFSDLEPPGTLKVQVRAKPGGRPLDARLSIEEGTKPLLGFFGKTVFFTELEPVGGLELPMAPGAYRLRVAAAEGFTSRAVYLDVTVEPGLRKTTSAEIEILADPAARGWYSGDMHHHSDVLDGFTEAEYVMRSELAAGLDVALLSDHDSTLNNPEMQRLAQKRGLPFIAGTELSPSWAHFNAYPLDEGQRVGIDTANAPVQEIFAEARRMGAGVIQLNHPFLNYGYFHSESLGEIPGGYSDGYDLVEITAADLRANSATLERTWKLWNEGRKAYLSAGSDAHDVWQEISGSARMFVHVAGALDVDSFVAALKRGNAYASTGPLVYPERMFGEEIRHPAGSPLRLAYTVQAVNGLQSVKLIEKGMPLAEQFFDGSDERLAVVFMVTPREDSWYSLVAEDAAGKFLVSNPHWVKLEDQPPAPPEGLADPGSASPPRAAQHPGH